MGKLIPIYGNRCQKPLDSSSKKVDQARLNAHSKALALRFEDGHHENKINKIGMQALKAFLLRASKVRYKPIPTLCSVVRKFQFIFHKQVPHGATPCWICWFLPRPCNTMRPFVGQPICPRDSTKEKNTRNSFDPPDIHDVKIFEGIPVI